MPIRFLASLSVSFLLLAVTTAAQTQTQTQAQTQTPAPAGSPQIKDTVDVVAVTPVDGIGLPPAKVAANVQVITAETAGVQLGVDVPTLLNQRAAGVHVNEAQGGSFQPDLQFRGFTSSPLLGASEGLAVYQDGVRVNEAFGDTINWDAIPAGAIATVSLIPGSNPLFGLNALGGAMSIRMKDGFSHPGRRASFKTGAYGRNQIDAELGGAEGAMAWFVAGSLIDEEGWRDHSPSTIRRLFSNVSRVGSSSQITMSVTAASNDLIGNGAAPQGLLEQDRSAVFTYPDRTDNDMALATVRGRRQISPDFVLEAVAYYRHGRIDTFNGDAAEDDDDDADVDELEDDEAEEAGAIGGFDGINNMSRTRTNAAGGTAQVTRTAALFGRANHFIAGGGLDAAASGFDFAAELATLTPDRGTVGSGLFDDDAFIDLRSRTTTASAFATNTWSASPAVAITASARVNWTDVALRDRIGTALTGNHTFARVNPAVGVTWQARPWINVYGSYTQSSRVPTPVELTCADPEDPCRLPNAFVSDPPLDQVVAGTFEAGARGRHGPAAWSLAAFRTRSTDDIVFVSSGRLRGEGHFENVDETHRAGVEATFELHPSDRLQVFVAYTGQRAVFGTDLALASPFHPDAEDGEIIAGQGARLPGIPAHSVKFGVSGLVTDRLQAGVNVRAQSGQYLRGDEANLLPRLPGFAVVNFDGRYRFTRRLALVGEVQNLFDAEYYTFGVLGDAELLGEEFEGQPRFYSPGAVRGAWIGVDVEF